MVNSICTITAGDLHVPMVMRTSENRTLFHNKYMYLMERDHTAMDCLKERIVEKNKLKLEYQKTVLASSHSLGRQTLPVVEESY